MKKRDAIPGKYEVMVWSVLLLFGLYLASLHGYPLFHSLAEIFSIVVAFGIIVIVWSSRRFLDANRLLLIGIVSIVVIGTLGGCQKQPGISKEPLEKVSIGMQDNISPALVWIAKGKGYFNEQGLDVELRKYPSGKLALLGLLNGEVDLSTTADIPIMASSFERNDYLVLCTIASSDKALWMVARKDKGITRPEDLRGKRIATQKNSAAHFFMSMFLLRSQIPESDVKISYLEPADLPKALINGDIDAFSMRNPFVQEAKDALRENAVEFFAPGAYRYTFNLVGRKDFVNAKPGLAERVMKALIKAEEFANNNKEQAIEVTAEQLGTGREKEVLDDWDGYVFKVSLDQSLIVTLEDEARWAIRNKFTDKTQVPNYLGYIYFNALEKVKPKAIGIIR